MYYVIACFIYNTHYASYQKLSYKAYRPTVINQGAITSNYRKISLLYIHFTERYVAKIISKTSLHNFATNYNI